MVKVFIALPTILLLYTILTAAENFRNCESGNHFQRFVGVSTRVLFGGDLQQAEHELRMILVLLSEGEGPYYRVAAVFDASEQLVAGSLRTLHAELIDFNGISHDCQLDIWSRPRLAEGTEITIRCDCMRTIVRHISEQLNF